MGDGPGARRCDTPMPRPPSWPPPSRPAAFASDGDPSPTTTRHHDVCAARGPDPPVGTPSTTTTISSMGDRPDHRSEELEAMTTADVPRTVLPIPERPHIGVTTFDAKDPDTSFP